MQAGCFVMAQGKGREVAGEMGDQGASLAAWLRVQT